MCVIIRRDPGIIIPEEKIWSACEVNPDGYGLSVIDRGKIETIKIFDPTGNKASDILKRLEDAKDQKVFLHLRYNTAGANSTDNCHPFKSFDDGPFEIQFMHNGTLTSFKENKDGSSDTALFNQRIITPTINAFYSIDGEDVLLNETLKRILEEFKGYSVFTLYDSNGKELTLENNSCKDHNGWWSSNEYSFNRRHREPVKNTYWNNYKKNNTKEDEDNNPFGPGTTGGTSNTQKMFPKPKETPTKTQAKTTGYAISQAKKDGLVNRYHTPPNKRVTFVELTEITDLKDILVFSEEEIYDLCNEQPTVATCLIMDLLYELWKKEKEQH